MRLEKLIAKILKAYPESTKFDMVAFELWGNAKEGFDCNDAWYLARGAEIPRALEIARGRWEVFKVNYLPRAKVKDIQSTGEIPYALTLEVDCVPWLEIRPCNA